jgi:hypothetical protein
MNHASCKDCIWCDQCEQEETCENYSPIEGGGEEDLSFYEQDLKMRGGVYADYVREINGGTEMESEFCADEVKKVTMFTAPEEGDR